MRRGKGRVRTSDSAAAGDERVSAAPPQPASAAGSRFPLASGAKGQPFGNYEPFRIRSR